MRCSKWFLLVIVQVSLLFGATTTVLAHPFGPGWHHHFGPGFRPYRYPGYWPRHHWSGWGYGPRVIVRFGAPPPPYWGSSWGWEPSWRRGYRGTVGQFGAGLAVGGIVGGVVGAVIGASSSPRVVAQSQSYMIYENTFPQVPTSLPPAPSWFHATP